MNPSFDPAGDQAREAAVERATAAIERELRRWGYESGHDAEAKMPADSVLELCATRALEASGLLKASDSEEKPSAILGFTPGWQDKPKAYGLFDAFACQSCGLVLPPHEHFVPAEYLNADPIPCACGGALYRRTLRLETDPDKPECPRCGGSGNYDDRDSTDDRLCPRCGGSGERSPDKPEGQRAVLLGEEEA